MNECKNLERIERNEERLNNHSDRIKLLEQYRSRTEVQMENLVEQIKDLVSTMKWMMGLFGTSLLGFFIWYIKNL